MDANATRGRPREREQTRQAIIEAARRVAERAGAANCSLSLVASEAGFATGTVYGYFCTKQELLLSLFAEDLTSVAGAMRDLALEEDEKPQQPFASHSITPRADKPFVSAPRRVVTFPPASDPPEQPVSSGANAASEDILEKPEDSGDIQALPSESDSVADANEIPVPKNEQEYIAEAETPPNGTEDVPSSYSPKVVGGFLSALAFTQADEASARSKETELQTGTAFKSDNRLQEKPRARYRGDRNTQDSTSGERAQLDAIIDRLVVPPVSPDSTPAMYTRLERRIGMFESELAQLSAKQAEIKQESVDLVSAAESKTVSLASRFEIGEQRQRETVSELRGELLGISTRLNALERATAITDKADHLSDVFPLAKVNLSPEPPSASFSDTGAANEHASGEPMQNYLSAARRSANSAASSAVAASGVEDTSRVDVRRYLLLASVAIVALAAAAFAFNRRPAPRNDIVMPTTAIHSHHSPNVFKKVSLLNPVQHAVLNNRASFTTPPAQLAVPTSTASLHAISPKSDENKERSLPSSIISQSSVAPPKIAPVPHSPMIGAAPLDRLTMLAESGNSKAELIVGLKYLDDTSLAANKARAAHWLKLAASKGQPVAQYRLGTFYQHGLGLPSDQISAMRWYEAAAAHGNIKAMYNLAFGYAEGWNGAKNYMEASRWYSAAARLGYTDAQFNLAVLYERGAGVPQSLLDAYKWYSIAARQGDKDASMRVEAIATQLSAVELSTAQAAAAEFRVEHANYAANTAPVLSDLLAARH